MEKTASALKALAPYLAGGVGLAALENRLVGEELPDPLKSVNLGIGAVTGALVKNPKTRAAALLGLPIKQMGLFGIGSLDKYRRQQQSLVDKNLEAATLNSAAAKLNQEGASAKNKLMLAYLLPALLAGGGLGYLGASEFAKNRKRKSRIPRNVTVGEKGKRTRGPKIRIDIPPGALPPDFFEALHNVDDNAAAHVRMLQSLTPDQRAALSTMPKAAAAEGLSVPGLAWDIAKEMTGVPALSRSFKDLKGFGSTGEGRYAAGSLGNLAIAIMAARTGGLPLLGRLIGKRAILRQMGRLPASVMKAKPGTPLPAKGSFKNLAKMLYRDTWGTKWQNRIRDIKLKTDPNKFKFTGATPFQRFKAAPAEGNSRVREAIKATPGYLANRAARGGYKGLMMARRSPNASLFLGGMYPATLGTERDKSDIARMNSLQKRLALIQGGAGSSQWLHDVLSGGQQLLTGSRPGYDLVNQLRLGN